jgi:hypothetical protein
MCSVVSGGQDSAVWREVANWASRPAERSLKGAVNDEKAEYARQAARKSEGRAPSPDHRPATESLNHKCLASSPKSCPSGRLARLAATEAGFLRQAEEPGPQAFVRHQQRLGSRRIRPGSE